ncbi:MAG: protein-tyrosine phosphatase family protein [Pseudomonadota bacterium]
MKQTDFAAHIVRFAHEICKSDEPRVYFHCSAGIHRTGFFVYGLLRLQGMDSAQARAELARLRPVTAEQVGTERLELADEIVAELEQHAVNER